MTTTAFSENFFERDAAEVAKDLLGSTILYRSKEGIRYFGSLKQKHIIMAKRTGMESYFAMGQVKQKLLHNQP